MSNIERAAEIIERAMGEVACGYPSMLPEIAQALADAGLLTPAPQIIRTVEELEVLNPDTLIQPPLTAFSELPQILTAAGLLDAIRTWEGPWLPAVKITEGAHVHACREALEGETT